MKLSNGDIFKDVRRWQKMYLKHIKAQGYSKNSVYLYNYTINSFVDYLYENNDEYGINSLIELNSVIFSGFLSFLDELSEKRGNKLNIEGNYLLSTSKASYLKALRSFFVFVSLNNREEFNFVKYFSNVRIGKPSEGKREFLDDEETSRLVSYLNSKKDTGNTRLLEILS